MWKIMVVVATLTVMAGCAKPYPASSASELVLLTRDGCVNTATMRAHLDDALHAMGRPTTYAVIDADTLEKTDARRGYGTPTILYGGHDLFGMTTPEPPFPEPT